MHIYGRHRKNWTVTWFTNSTWIIEIKGLAALQIDPRRGITCTALWLIVCMGLGTNFLNFLLPFTLLYFTIFLTQKIFKQTGFGACRPNNNRFYFQTRWTPDSCYSEETCCRETYVTTRLVLHWYIFPFIVKLWLLCVFKSIK